MKIDNKKYIKLITFGNFPSGGASANLLKNFVMSISKKYKVEVLLPRGYYYGNKVGKKISKIGFIDDVKFRHLFFLYHPKNIIGKLVDNFSGVFLLACSIIKYHINNKIDIIIVYNTNIIRTLSLLFLSKVLKKKFIIILPEFYEKPSGGFLALAKWYNFYFSLRYFVKYADSFIVASFFLKKYLRSKLKSKKEIYVLPNLVDINSFTNIDVPPFKKNKITIGYSGTPTRKDGVVDLINSFAVLNKTYNHLHLLIIGDITNGDSLIPELKRIASDLKVENSITFTGLVPFSDVPRLLNSCQILALTRPSGIFAEAGFPTKLGEYFACKKPVLITEVGDMPTYFKNENHVILVEPDNINSIVNGFEKIINSQDLSKKLIENGYKWMADNLDYNRVSNKLCTFLEK